MLDLLVGRGIGLLGLVGLQLSFVGLLFEAVAHRKYLLWDGNRMDEGLSLVLRNFEDLRQVKRDFNPFSFVFFLGFVGVLA